MHIQWVLLPFIIWIDKLTIHFINSKIYKTYFPLIDQSVCVDGKLTSFEEKASSEKNVEDIVNIC